MRKPVKMPKQRQTEEETDHKQDHEHMKDHTKPRCLNWGEEKARFRSKDKESRERCQAIGREVQIVHHREGEYQRVGEKSELSTTVRGSTSSFTGTLRSCGFCAIAAKASAV